MQQRLLVLAVATALVVPALALPACSETLGGVRVNVHLENDAKTQCLVAWAATDAGYSSYSDPVPRTESDLVFGIQETPELAGFFTVGVNLFSTPNCAGAHYWSDTQHVTMERGKITTINFTFDFGTGDGGTDAGVDDGGTDAGCNPLACTTPPECQRVPGSCSGGACVYEAVDAGATCSQGVCNGQGACTSAVCRVLNVGDPCNDGLSCTTNDRCLGANTCLGSCQPIDCGTRSGAIMCGADGGCVYTPDPVNSPCGTNGRCDGQFACKPWFPFTPSNLPDVYGQLTPPTMAWTAAPGADGGPCLLDTSTLAPRDVAANCGFLGQGALYSPTDGGVPVAVFAATALTVPAGVELRFVGSRPAVLSISGDATIFGALTAAARTGDEPPAGADTPDCLVYSPLTQDQGGEGGSYRTLGGRGGNNGTSDAGRLGTDVAIPLRGGCPGARGGGAVPGDGGVAGGALQLTAMGQLLVGDGGVLSVSGAGGLGGTNDHRSGGGGGSGGTLLLEARNLVLLNCALTANGGGGGEGGKNGQPTGAPGADGTLSTTMVALGGLSTAGGFGGNGAAGTGGAVTAATNGSNGSGNEGGGGGGGGLGLIRLNSVQGCTRSGDVRSGEVKASHPTCN